MYKKPIVIGLSPNLFIDDMKRVLNMIFKPWLWKSGSYIQEIENWAKKYFQVSNAVTFNAGRSALLVALQSLNLHKDDEVLLQAFTCVAVPNAVIWANLKPIFVDIDDTFNLNIKDALLKLTQKSKVLIVQHTFGVPVNLDEIMNFCKEHNLILIEDCAHALGATYHGKAVGTFGDISIFSFGRDKIISSVFGGMAITNNKLLGTKITQLHDQLEYPGTNWILQQLLHPIITWFSLKLYSVANLGKLLLFVSQKLQLLSMPVYREEKELKQPDIFPKKFPNALAYLAINQLNQLTTMNETRQHCAIAYSQRLNKEKYILPKMQDGAVYLRYNVLTSNASAIRKNLKQQRIILGNWYHHVIDPNGVILNQLKYKLGSCPKAEIAAKMSLNLPTSPTLNQQQVQHLISLLNK